MVKEFRYIYNMEQANFYLQNGLTPIGVGIGGKNEVFLKFIDGEVLQTVFKKWCARKQK